MSLNTNNTYADTQSMIDGNTILGSRHDLRADKEVVPERMRGQFFWKGKFRRFSYAFFSLPWSFTYQTILISSVIYTYGLQLYILSFLEEHASVLMDISMYFCLLLFCCDILITLLHAWWPLVRANVRPYRRNCFLIVLDILTTLFPLSGLYGFLTLLYNILIVIYGSYELVSASRWMDTLRIYRIFIYYSFINEAMHRYRKIAYMLEHLFLVVLTLHAGSCFWYRAVMALDVKLDYETIHIPPQTGAEMLQYQEYLNCWYVCSCRLFNVIFGHTFPISTAQKWLTSFISLFGFVYLRYRYIGMLAWDHMVRHFRRLTFVDRYHHMMAYLVFHKAPPKLAEQARQYKIELWKMKDGVIRSSHLKSLPLALQMELIFDINVGHFHDTLLFRDLNEAFMRHISLLMRHELFLAGQTIWNQGIVKSGMICVKRGVIEMLSDEDDESPMISFKEGSVLGELSLFFSIPAKVTVKAATYVELQVLRRTEFMRNMVEQVAILSKLRKKIMKRMNDVKKREDGIAAYDSKDSRLIRTRYRPMKVLKNKLMGIEEEDLMFEDDSHLYYRDEQNLRQEKFTTEYLELYQMTDNVTTIDWPRICVRSTFPWILEADTAFTQMLDAIHFLVVVYLCISTPYTAILANETSHTEEVLNTIVKFLLVVDIYTQLTTAIVDKDSRKETMKDIAEAKMAEFGFYLDILSLFPIHIFVDAVDPHGETILGQVAQLCPILQVWHIWGYMNKWSKNFYANAKFFCLLKYSLLFTILCYWTGCFLYLYSCPKKFCRAYSWMSQLIYWETKVLSSTDAHHEKPVLASIAFGTAVFTGTGSSNIAPGARDLLVVMFAFILGSYLYCEYCSTLCSIFMLQTQRRLKFQESMRELFYFLSVNHVSEKIKSRVRKFFSVQWYYNKAVHTEEIFREMSSNIQQEVQSIEMVDTLTRCPLFQTVAANTRTIVLPDREVVQHAADIGRDMYVLQKGYCDLVNHNGKTVMSAKPGSSFGVIEMLYGLPKVYTVLTTTNCILLHVQYSALVQCLSSFPDISYSINEVINNEELRAMATEFEQAKPMTGRLMSKTNRIAQELKESFVFVAPEGRKDYVKAYEQLGVMRWIRFIIIPMCITPHGFFLKCWCALRFFFAVYYVLTVPYRIAVSTRQDNFKWRQDWCDLFLYFDILVMSYVAYYNEKSVLVTHPMLTIKHYLKHAFVLDLLSVFPFERLFSVINNQTELDQYRMNRVLQVTRITGAFSYWESDIMSLSQAVVLLKHLPLAITLVNIVTAIMFVHSCKTFMDRSGSGYVSANCTAGLITSDIAWKVEPNAMLEYIKRFYWAFDIFLGCGCSTYNSSSTYDTWIIIPLQILGLLYFAFMHGYVASTRSATANALLKHTDQINDLANFLFQENVDQKLTDKTIKYFEYVWKRTNGSNPQQICKRLNSALMEDTLVFMYEKTLREVPLFSNVERSFIRVITQHLKEMYFIRGETVVQCRDLQQYIYIIYRGKVDVLSSYNEMITCMGPGGMFGNFTGQQVSCSAVTIFASRSLDLLVIPSVTFFNLIKYYPKLQAPLNKAFQRSKDYILPITVDAPDEELSSDGSQWSSDDEATSVDTAYASRSGSSHSEIACGPLSSRSSQSTLSHGRTSVSSSALNFNDQYRPGAMLYQIWGYITCTMATISFCLVLYSIVTLNDCYFLSWVMAFCDVFFYMKIHFSMHQGYFTREGGIVLVASKCRRKYFKKKCKLYMDILANIPLEPFAFLYSKPTRIIHYLHTNKLLRIKYLLEFYKRTSSELTNNLTVLQVAMTVYTVVLLIHTLTCMWLLLMTATNPYYIIRTLKMHLIGHEPMRHIWEYTTSFYVISSRLTGTGGDEYQVDGLIPTTVLTVCLVAGKMLGAIVVATAMQTEYAIKHALMSYEKKTIELIDVLKNQGLSAYQLQKLWKYVKQLWVSERGRQLPKLLSQTPYVRRCDLMCAMFGHHLHHCFLFQDTGEAFLRQLTVVLEYTVFFPGNYIVVAGDIEARMYWVSSGIVSVVSVRTDLTETTHELLHPGDVFGIVQGLNRGLAHCFSYRAETKVSILSLCLDTWTNILQFFPDAQQIINERAEVLFAQL